MAKTIFEELGGRYERQGDYLIPCITLLAEKEQPIGLFGRRHLDYLKQHRRVTYINLLTSGKLNAYLDGMCGLFRKILSSRTMHKKRKIFQKICKVF